MHRFPASATLAVLALAACGRDGSGGGRAGGPGAGWGGYNKAPDGQRFATLTQIDTRNVARLKPVCELKLGQEGPFQTGPVVVGDTMFLTTSHTTVAMNAATCAVRWEPWASTRSR